MCRLAPACPWARGLSAYLALLPAGFAMPSESPRRGALLPHHFTLTADFSDGVCFLLHFPSDCSALTLSSTGPGNDFRCIVRSSDFPHPDESGRDRRFGRDGAIIGKETVIANYAAKCRLVKDSPDRLFAVSSLLATRHEFAEYTPLSASPFIQVEQYLWTRSL